MAQRTQSSLALLFIDLDYFKEVNDTLGHDIGDKLLVKVAGRINRCVRQTDTVARMGGDEFTVILPQVHDPVFAGKIAASIIQSLVEPFTIDGNMLKLSASIGITISPRDGADADNLLKSADVAMYVAKNAGRNRFSYFGDTVTS